MLVQGSARSAKRARRQSDPPGEAAAIGPVRFNQVILREAGEQGEIRAGEVEGMATPFLPNEEILVAAQYAPGLSPTDCPHTERSRRGPSDPQPPTPVQRPLAD